MSETRTPLHQCSQDNVSFGHAHNKGTKVRGEGLLGRVSSRPGEPGGVERGSSSGGQRKVGNAGEGFTHPDKHQVVGRGCITKANMESGGICFHPDELRRVRKGSVSPRRTQEFTFTQMNLG